jgi:hypothetical protein
MPLAAPAPPPKPLAPPSVLPALPGLSPRGAPPVLPGLPPLGGVPAAPVFKTEAAKAPLKEEEKAGFDAIFGTPAPPPPGAKQLPAVELKTEAGKAPLAEKDLENFSAIFGDAPPKRVGPPPAIGAVPAPPPLPKDLANFDAIFGNAPAAAPAPAAPKPEAAASSGMDDLNNMFK